jgi:hypothetical protein
LGCGWRWVSQCLLRHLPCRVGGRPIQVVESYPPSYPHLAPQFPPFGHLGDLPQVVSPELSTPPQIGIDIGISSGIVDRWPTRARLQTPGNPPDCVGDGPCGEVRMTIVECRMTNQARAGKFEGESRTVGQGPRRPMTIEARAGNHGWTRMHTNAASDRAEFRNQKPDVRREWFGLAPRLVRRCQAELRAPEQ